MMIWFSIYEKIKIPLYKIIRMKKILIATVSLMLLSCGSNDSKTTEDTKSKNEVGVQNVNGGIPDTTNAIDLSTHKKDTTMNAKDSLK
jgi:hypothetical protein